MKYFICFFIMLNAIDLIQTYHILRREDLIEANPIIRFLHSKLGGFKAVLIFKIIIVTFCLLIAPLSVLIFLVLLYTFIVISNDYNLRVN